MAAGRQPGPQPVALQRHRLRFGVEGEESSPGLALGQPVEPAPAQAFGQRGARMAVEKGPDLGVTGARQAAAQFEILEVGQQGIVAEPFALAAVGPLVAALECLPGLEEGVALQFQRVARARGQGLGETEQADQQQRAAGVHRL